MFRIAFLFFCLSAATVGAQVAYGKGTPGTGGIVPDLSAPQAYMGNAGFHFLIRRGLGGATGFLGLALQPGSLFLGQTEILIALPPLVLFPFALSGPAGTPGAGSAAIPLPLTFPPNPQLAGAEFYAQAVILDFAMAGSPAATRGLRVELTYPPLVFAGTSVGGGADPYYVVDPLTLQLVHRGGVSQTDNVTGAAFAYGGKGLFVGSSIRNQVNYADMTTMPPRWRTIYTSAGKGCYGIGYAKNQGRLYTLTDPGTNTRELVVLNVADPRSTNFGQPLGRTTNLAGGSIYVERWALSPSGKLAAVLVGILPPVDVVFVDTDPNSSRYLQVLGRTRVPMAGGLALATRVAFTQDETGVLVLIQYAGTTPGEVARFDLQTNTWLDHNPSQPGIQNIGSSSSPRAAMGSAPTDIEVSPDGKFVVVVGFGSGGWAARIDLVPGQPSRWGFRRLAASMSLPGAWACGLARDGAHMTIGNFPNPGRLVFWDPVRDVGLGTVTLPGVGNLYTIEHR